MINNEARSFGFMAAEYTDDELRAIAKSRAQASNAGAAAAEAAGKVQEQAQAAAMQQASAVASIPASIGYKPPVVWYRQKGFMIAAGGAGALLLLYLALSPAKKRPAVVHSRPHPKK